VEEGEVERVAEIVAGLSESELSAKKAALSAFDPAGSAKRIADLIEEAA